MSQVQNSQWVGTTNVSNVGYNVPIGESKQLRTPEGLLVTRAVETKAGWVGQIIVDENIVWESEPVTAEDNQSHELRKEALHLANKRVVEGLGRLFA